MMSIAILALLGLANALGLAKPDGAPKVLSSNVVRAGSTPSLAEIPLKAPWLSASFSVEISIGTPPQTLHAQLDTGNSDLVVVDARSAVCQNSSCFTGTFTQNSSTLKTLNTFMKQNYFSSVVNGDWAQDTLQFGGATLQNFSFGIANQSTVAINVFGLGFPSDVLYALPASNPTNQTAAGAFVANGLTKSASFSLYLGKGTKPSSILFGGVDKSLYQGSLHTYPMSPNGNGLYDHLALDIAAINIAGIQTSGPLRTVINPATPLMLLPPAFVEAVWAKSDATIVDYEDSTFGVVNCSLANSSETVDFFFSDSLIIALELGALISTNPEDLAPLPLNKTETVGKCLSYMIPSQTGAEAYIVGHTFLQAAYIAYDFDALEVAIAPINLNPGPSDIWEIAAGSNILNLTSTATPTLSSTAAPTATPSHSNSASSHLSRSPAIAMLGLLAVAGLAC